MDIISAYQEVGTYRGAAEICATTFCARFTAFLYASDGSMADGPVSSESLSAASREGMKISFTVDDVAVGAALDVVLADEPLELPAAVVLAARSGAGVLGSHQQVRQGPAQRRTCRW